MVIVVNQAVDIFTFREGKFLYLVSINLYWINKNLNWLKPVFIVDHIKYIMDMYAKIYFPVNLDSIRIF